MPIVRPYSYHPSKQMMRKEGLAFQNDGKYRDRAPLKRLMTYSSISKASNLLQTNPCTNNRYR